MAERAETLAAKIEQANSDAIATIEGMSGDQWTASCEDEGWSVAVTAHHIASGYTPLTGLVQAVANGADLPALTMDMIDQGNARHAEQFANCSKEETLEMLRSGGSAAAAAVRGLSDEQLDKSAVILEGEAEITTEQIIENLLIGSITGHHASIQKSI